MARYTRYVIKFVSDLRQVSGFVRFPPPIQLTATILLTCMLKVVENTITLNTRSYRRIMNIGNYDVVALCHSNLFYYMTIGHLDLL